MFGELKHLKTKTRLIDEMFTSVMTEYVFDEKFANVMGECVI